ncbi:PREDICTED: serine/threonine-protein kinase apg-1-like isoform X1 [Erythranthe guttata]|uniref:serine/threonine-protein kinase apg-1-like isoform X1 n=1 Tax=Erythranthe guttata TaxID=4155 RepID=UPI00064DAAB7|nr:PREDICTED: serine/threonine-protein kinase apg-1-like isoform X1 [Erythranthe guttata]|eukprot:XP_012850383.1 PREDICTED: serine/threonine-protein kinase apg-1-like isoform X1 [Erythranthe guttata]
MMAQPARRYYVVGDYMVGKQIGAGSFSTVWHARHRVHGTEVAIKEIVTARLNPKLHESLKSEIFILKRINHPNIIRLHDMIEESGKIYIVLEYCKGGDLSMYIQQRHGKVSEATAKHFMQQLAEGLKVLRENNLIHRDLKPQNLLLCTNDDNSVLKIADFGFARSLQPKGLAETLCGSPLYMAPEIMQFQKYDAKADLWSVGAILFQLVTGKTPFTGNNQLQLLQNIMRSIELQFPPEARNLSPHCTDLCRKLLRRNPVERLTFEEFFNHPYLSDRQPAESFRNRQPQRLLNDFPQSERNTTAESSQDYCLPFSLDDDSSSPPSPKNPTMRSTYGFSLDSKSPANVAPRKTEITGSRLGSRQLSDRNLKDSLKITDLGSLDNHPKVVDSLESIDRDYVIVSGHPLDSSSSARAVNQSHSPPKTTISPLDSGNINMVSSGPQPMIGREDDNGILESRILIPTTSERSMVTTGNTLEQPSSDCMTRIKSLQHCASCITALVNEKIGGGKQLEAFSVQLVILAIWKQALHICHTYAASASEGSSSQETTRLREASRARDSPDSREFTLDIANAQEPHDICLQIERAFLGEVETAEELAKVIEPGNMEMPDAMELVFQSALAFGKSGAVVEYMGNVENAVVLYAKAVDLLVFLLVEAPCLILNPPFSLTNSDRYRIRNYIDALNNRKKISQSQRMALFKADVDRPCTS